MIDFIIIGAKWGALVGAFAVILIVLVCACIGLMFVLAAIGEMVADNRKRRQEKLWGLFHRWQKINAQDWVEFEAFKSETQYHFSTWRDWDRKRKEEERTHG